MTRVTTQSHALIGSALFAKRWTPRPNHMAIWRLYGDTVQIQECLFRCCLYAQLWYRITGKGSRGLITLMAAYYAGSIMMDMLYMGRSV